MNRIVPILVLAGLALACTRESAPAAMFPDYSGVTVPCNIAPLNFHYSGAGRPGATTFSAGSASYRARGRQVRIPQARWNSLLEAAKGGSIKVENRLTGPWEILVSADSIDSYLTYRLIEPGYEVWNKVEIRERNISSFSERTISSWKNTGNACMNCHIHKGGNSLFYLRGKGGGAIYNHGGALSKLRLKAEGMISGTVYGDIHPSGRWGVFSANVIIPSFHTEGSRRFEVYDSASDLCVAELTTGTMLQQAEYARPDVFETFPCFSADGCKIFYCAADTVTLPRDIRKLRYSLISAPFDSETGHIGPAEVIWDAGQRKASVCHPKSSPDGKWLLYTVSDYGTFPIWHRECGLELMDLATGATRMLDEVNSDRSDTYHSWSSNSRWFVFASKRGDGQYGRPWICHVGEDGRCGKPFILPQQDPHHYEDCFKSYNIPDLGAAPVPYDWEDIPGIIKQ